MSDTSEGSSSCPTSKGESSTARKAVRSYGIAIDSSKIHEVAYDEQPELLRDLGVNVFEQEVFEEGVLRQVDDAISELEGEYERNRLEKELANVEKELRHTEQKIKKIGKNVSENCKADKFLVVVENLTERRDTILQKLTAHPEQIPPPSASNEDTTTSEICRDGVNTETKTTSNEENSTERLLSMGGHEPETYTERLIRLGEMTPFGSTIEESGQARYYDIDRSLSVGDLAKFEKQSPENDNHDNDYNQGIGDGGRTSDDNFNQDMIDLNDNRIDDHNHGIDDESFDGDFNQEMIDLYHNDDDAGQGIDDQAFDNLNQEMTGHNFDDNQGIDTNDEDNGIHLDDNDNDDLEMEDDQAVCDESDEEYIPDEEELKLSWEEDTNDVRITMANKNADKDINISSDKELSSSEYRTSKKAKKHRKKTKKKEVKQAIKDDGDDHVYQTRMKEVKLKKVFKERGIDYEGKSDDEDQDSWDDEAIDEEFDKGLRIPGKIWRKLFRFQKTGVKWLWELHCQQAGGIVGDEMGLGKTIQTIAFLAGLKHSNIGARSLKQSGLGPVLIICPATIMYQWVAEFHKWSPEFRIAVLHDTGSYQGTRKENLVTKIRNTPGILVTTYSGVRLNQEYLLPVKWDYVILDEGHMIRNPDAEITLACKQFRTAHRIVLSGSPMQNNLRELWSLFDFVFPGKLGTLPVFMQEFSVPITMGGYANASPVQVQTAYKCACVLRDTINPYLLRRLKKDVKMKLDLPNKSEQVLFCRLTQEQTEIYKEYLSSREVGSILSGSMKVFPGLIMLRKICNHPDLTTQAGSLWKLRKDEAAKQQGNSGKEADEADEYGYWQRSGKLIVVHSLLKLWKRQKHKVLLFSQTCQMLKILEIFVKSQGYNYVRMDGTTAIAKRQTLVHNFNKDKSIFVFLLTTRVGGLGVNLVGANRVVIYDPDWNPGTDMQAKERAWRVGQTRDVTIYRLLTTGTIEEKIYHRQIFKQFLTNRVLKDPKQRRFFKSNDLFELFTLDDIPDNKNSSHTTTETGAIFAGIGCEVNVPTTKVSKRKALEAIKDESLIKLMKEKTKEILKAQFSSTKLTETVNTNPSKNTSDSTAVNTKNVEQCFTGEEAVKLNVSSKYTDNNFEDEFGCSSKSNTNVAASLGSSSSPSDAVKTLNGAEGNLAVSSTVEWSDKNDLDKSLKCDTTLAADEGEENIVKRKGFDVSLSSTTKKRKFKEKEKAKAKKGERKRRNKIEGVRIGQLSHSEPYTSTKDAEEAGEHDDQYILRKLFKKSGVHSALQHDTIVDSGNADNFLVENEAKRVASQAAHALKRSRDQCMRHRASGLPTWTGHSGIVGSPHGIPSLRPIFGSGSKTGSSETANTSSSHFSGDSLFKAKADTDLKSAADPMPSAQLLARMRARNFTGGSSNAGTVVPAGEQNHERTMAEMRDFIATGGSIPGRATTREILAGFSSKLPVSGSAVFRAMLKTICDFDRDASGEGYWVLKPEFSGHGPS